MDGATFDWVFTFLPLNREGEYTENYDTIYATLVAISLYNKRGGRMNAKQLESSIRGNVR